MRAYRPGESPRRSTSPRATRRSFPSTSPAGGRGSVAVAGAAPSRPQVFCVAPLKYVGHAALEGRPRELQGGARRREGRGGLPAGEHARHDRALAAATSTIRARRRSSSRSPTRCARNTRRSSTPASCCRSTTPTCPTAGRCTPDMSVADYRKYATLRVDALNHALRGIPREKIRLHVCWGSFHGPHQQRHPARTTSSTSSSGCAPRSYSIEASNPCHEHEWRVFEDVEAARGRDAHSRRGRPLPPTSSSTPSWSPSGWCATRSSSAARTSWPAPTAASARASGTRDRLGEARGAGRRRAHREPAALEQG